MIGEVDPVIPKEVVQEGKDVSKEKIDEKKVPEEKVVVNETIVKEESKQEPQQPQQPQPQVILQPKIQPQTQPNSQKKLDNIQSIQLEQAQPQPTKKGCAC